MKTVQVTTEQITLDLSKDEIAILANALNEVCNGIESSEFEARLGGKMHKAHDLLAALTSEYAKMK